MNCDVGKATERLEMSSAHSSLHLRHNSFSNPSVASPTSQLILQAFSHFTYVTAHSDSPSFLSLHLRHSSFSNPSLTLPMSQLILQPFRCFTYVTAHSPTLLSPLLRHRIFIYVTWWAAHAAFKKFIKNCTSKLVGAGIRASFFNRSNDATVRTWEVPLVLASCDVITLSHTCSRFMQ